MTYFMYVTISGEDKILIFTMDGESGGLEPRGSLAVPGRPAPLAMAPDRRFLHVARRDANEISSFGVDQRTGALSLIGTAALEADPNYLAMDRKGRFLLSAYYQGGKAAVHPVGDDGAVTAPPVEWLDTHRGAHCFQTDPSNRFAFVPHVMDSNVILQFRFDEATGRLTPNSPPSFKPPDGEGPRHYCFHPSRDILYFSNEQGCSVTAYHFDPSAGTLAAFQTISTLPPEGYAERNTCAQIQITSSGRFLYAPNRGHNSIACFSVDASSGRLTSLGQVPTEPVPRAISLDPEGNFLYVAGLESGRLASYRIDGDTGKLEPLEVYTVGTRPMWVLITRLAG